MSVYGGIAEISRNPLRLLAGSRCTWGCVGVLMAIHGVGIWTGQWESWVRAFALDHAEAMAGHVWRILTYAGLHGNGWHLLTNVMLLLGIGPRIERIHGAVVMLKVALTGVLIGGLFHLLLGTGILVGFSPGCLALLFLLTTVSPESRMLPVPVSAKNLARGIILAELIFCMVNPGLGLAVLSQVGHWMTAHGMASVFQVGHACHIGGALVGWIYGRWLLRVPVTLEELRQQRSQRECE